MNSEKRRAGVVISDEAAVHEGGENEAAQVQDLVYGAEHKALIIRVSFGPDADIHSA